MLRVAVEILSLDVFKDKLGEKLNNRYGWFFLGSKGSFSRLSKNIWKVFSVRSVLA